MSFRPYSAQKVTTLGFDGGAESFEVISRTGIYPRVIARFDTAAAAIAERNRLTDIYNAADHKVACAIQSFRNGAR